MKKITTKTGLILGGIGVLLVGTVLVVRAKKKKSESEANEAFALMENEVIQSPKPKGGGIKKVSTKSTSGKKRTGSRSSQSKSSGTLSRSQTVRLNSLQPSVKSKVLAMIEKAKQQGIKLFIVSAHRDEAEQNELYSRGRSQGELNKKGLGHIKAQPQKRKVTNAYAGKSDHNIRRAVDLVEQKGKDLIWDSPRWDQIGKIGESVGLKWGGRWKSFIDKPHFYDLGGQTTASLWKQYKSTGRYA